LKITIFGVGLIGGSLALCFKGKPGVTVVGHSPRASSLEKYLEYNVVDVATSSFAEAISGADFIFLCVPVGNLDEYLNEIYKHPLKHGCIVTDVGSTKQSVMECAAQIANQLPLDHSNRNVYFIGGHPMAGSERSGVEAATSDLFENAFYVLTPSSDTPLESYARLERLLHLTKANVVKMDARSHDEIVGAISHLPHMIAVALVNQISRYNESNECYKTLAAGGFRDITRIASAEPFIWRDILLNNKEILLRLLEDWSREIGTFKDMLHTEDGEAIVEAFTRSGMFRSQIPEKRKGMIYSAYEIYVDVPDNPGILGQITTLHGEHQINIRNIQIMETRTDVPGVLRLSYRNEQEMDVAVKLLRKQGLSVFIR
jgi:prephenate dehydrogenase